MRTRWAAPKTPERIHNLSFDTFSSDQTSSWRVCRTRLSWDATSSGSESKSWQYRSWRSGCARRNELCAFVEILTVTKYWRKQVDTRQNRRYITVPAEHKSASCWFRRAMVCIIMRNTTIQVVSPKKSFCTRLTLPNSVITARRSTKSTITYQPGRV